MICLVCIYNLQIQYLLSPPNDDAINLITYSYSLQTPFYAMMVRFLTGDFNLLNINWFNFTRTLVPNQLVFNSTRGNNIFNLVFTSDVFALLNFQICEQFWSSDHNSVSFQSYFPHVDFIQIDVYSLYSDWNSR